MSKIGAVIGWKFNHQAGMETKNGVITAFPGGIPSDEDINTWKNEYDAHFAATAYQGKRAAEYPSFEDQFDLIYHSGIDAWKAKIKETKDKFPKS